MIIKKMILLTFFLLSVAFDDFSSSIISYSFISDLICSYSLYAFSVMIAISLVRKKGV